MEFTFQLNVKASVRAAELAGRPLPQFRRDLLLYLMASSKMRYISGHFWYSEFAFEQFGKDWDFVTVLRDPVARWFSHYFYNRHKRSGYWRLNESLSEFLDTDLATLYGRFYTHVFAGGAESSNGKTHSPCDAIAALERFALVGMLEKLDPFCEELNRRFGLLVDVPLLNTNPLAKKQQEQQVSDEIRERVRELCQPDLEVYEYVRGRMSSSGLAS